MATTCRSTSRYGDCHRHHKHNGPHAVHIADDVWFAYQNRRSIGYGHFDGDTFIPAEED